MFHPVTSESAEMKHCLRILLIVCCRIHMLWSYFPNNLGSRLYYKKKYRVCKIICVSSFPSLRFEYFLTLFKSSQFIIGNSSAGIREAPYYGIPIINVRTRQQNRVIDADIINVGYKRHSINKALETIDIIKRQNDCC
jgi:UDP-N-acetylglucosamine 2-epimerase (hydrolysing)